MSVSRRSRGVDGGFGKARLEVLRFAPHASATCSVL